MLGNTILKPKPWPRMDFSSGVPDTSRTIVAIPSMLNDTTSIEKLVADLEIRYLGNRDKNILFTLLTDFCDAKNETEDQDHSLLVAVSDGIKNLNAKYFRDENRAPFYLFHRSRKWNPADCLWMGYERKRGKLSDFNSYLRDHNKDSFSTVVGDTMNLKNIRYVITLDADSVLPRETATQLIATMSHPFNHPEIDPSSRTIKNGYGILQPRVSLHLQNVTASRFTRLFSDDFGIDPYTKSVSDVYQDLFNEGSFIGKGIYDIDAFQRSLEFRFPVNRILSHDLIESGFARSGLVSDIQLIEEFPSNFSTDCSRKHRWIRGDWQIATWIMPRIPDENNLKEQNPLSGLTRWKIFDNLRRSVTPIATLALFLLCWGISGISSSILTVWLILYISIPQFLTVNSLRIWRSPHISRRQARREQWQLIIRALFITFMNVIFLPYEAFISADAAIRSLYRITISKKMLLQWQPASNAEKATAVSPIIYSKTMWFAPFTALIASMLIVNSSGSGSYIFLFLSAGWLISPIVAWWISQPTKQKVEELSTTQQQFLQMLSRRTRCFFETYITAGDQWLPPDNIQEYPNEIVAHRTSPTNIGLALVSSLGAFDSGYISLHSLVKRLENTFQSMEKMVRFKGHFYNWYDTQTLEPLNPQYVSTVDSGNLAGALLVLRQGLLELAEGTLESKEVLQGLNDTFLVAREAFLSIDPNTSTLALNKINKCIDIIKQSLEKDSAMDVAGTLEKILIVAKEIQANSVQNQTNETSQWIAILVRQIEDHINYFYFLAKGDTKS